MICALVDFEMTNKRRHQTSGAPISNSEPLQTRQLIKVDEYGEHSTFDVYSEADYDETTNMWNINGTNNVSFNDVSLISGGAFTIMFLYQQSEATYTNERFVTFRGSSGFQDINIKRGGVTGVHLQVSVGSANWNFYGLLNIPVNTKIHFTIVIIPNQGYKVYTNGLESLSFFQGDTPGDIPSNQYTSQTLGGYDSTTYINGSIGNFRFYNKELTASEILEIGSVGTTTNDLLAFNITTRLFQTQPRQLIKVDKYGEHSTFNAYSEAPYDTTTNMWNINRTNNVEFNDEPLISGGAFTIMFSYQPPSVNTIYANQEFVSFRTDPNVLTTSDIIIRRWLYVPTNVNDTIEIWAGGKIWAYYGVIGIDPNIKDHFTIVIVPNVGVKLYKNGIQITGNTWTNHTVIMKDTIKEKIYNYQNLGGTGTNLLYGSIGNFRFYDRELSSDEIFALGSTTNDLVAFRKIDEVFTTANVGYFTEADDYPTFRCKMPYLPSDVPHMMGIELLQASVTLDRTFYPYTGTFLYLLDNADNCHNNTLKNEICLARLESKYWRWFPQVEGENALNGTNTNQSGIVSFQTMSNEKPIKMYIPTKQNYLYFQLQDKGTRSDGHLHIVNKAKLIVRLTFDTKQNEYQPKRIML